MRQAASNYPPGRLQIAVQRIVRASQETTMHAAKTAADDLRDAYAAADVLVSEAFRKYLFTSGRLLPVLVARFRDDMAEALGMELPEIPRRNGHVRPAKLDDLTSAEFGTLWGAIDALVERFTSVMDDPELPRLLRALRAELVRERTEREQIEDELTQAAKAS
jgi:signal transduction histidine kinase